MAKVKPSALGLVSWKSKLVLNCCTFTGAVKKALRASFELPSVKRSLLPFNAAPPFRVSCDGGVENPSGNAGPVTGFGV